MQYVVTRTAPAPTTQQPCPPLLTTRTARVPAAFHATAHGERADAHRSYRFDFALANAVVGSVRSVVGDKADALVGLQMYCR